MVLGPFVRYPKPLYYYIAVVFPPLVDDDLRFLQAVKDLISSVFRRAYYFNISNFCSNDELLSTEKIIVLFAQSLRLTSEFSEISFSL
jgi:hypothetical protein